MLHLQGIGGECCAFHVLDSCHHKVVLTPDLLYIVVEVKAFGLPHVLRLWLGVSKGILLVRYFYDRRYGNWITTCVQIVVGVVKCIQSVYMLALTNCFLSICCISWKS